MEKSEMAPVIIGKLLNIGGMLHKNGNRMLRPSKLNQQQFSILFSISQEEKVQQKKVINKLLLEKAHVSKVVKKLHAMGLIEVIHSEQDKRSSWLKITEGGKKTVRECRKSIQDWNEEWTEELDIREMESLMQSLSLLQDIFKRSARVPDYPQPF